MLRVPTAGAVFLLDAFVEDQLEQVEVSAHAEVMARGL
jgi:hypothetical protein